MRKPLEDVRASPPLLCKRCEWMLVSLAAVKWLSLCGARMSFDGGGSGGLRVCAEEGSSKLGAGVCSSWLEADRETRLHHFERA